MVEGSPNMPLLATAAASDQSYSHALLAAVPSVAIAVPIQTVLSSSSGGTADVSQAPSIWSNTVRGFGSDRTDPAIEAMIHDIARAHNAPPEPILYHGTSSYHNYSSNKLYVPIRYIFTLPDG